MKTLPRADWEKAMGRTCTNCGAPPGQPCGFEWRREHGKHIGVCHDSRRIDPPTPRQTMGCLGLLLIAALAYALFGFWICLGGGAALGLE